MSIRKRYGGVKLNEKIEQFNIVRRETPKMSCLGSYCDGSVNPGPEISWGVASTIGFIFAGAAPQCHSGLHD